MRAHLPLLATASLFVALAACGSSDSDDASPGGAAGSAGGGAVAGTTGTAGTGTAGSGTAGSGTAGSGTAGTGTAGAAGSSTGPLVTYGDPYAGGQFHLGPVTWDESSFHNACAPGGGYSPAIQQAEGNLLAGLWGGIPNVGGYCDACIHVVTAKGKSATLRVVTYGDTTTNSIDVSPEAYQILDSGEFPREMTWTFAKCPDTGKITYEFQTGSSEWWTSLWVRNARVPLKSVEVKSANHASFVSLQRGGDGTLTDGGGFGKGPFSIRLTGVDGQVYTDDFAWPANGVAGAVLSGAGNLQ